MKKFVIMLGILIALPNTAFATDGIYRQQLPHNPNSQIRESYPRGFDSEYRSPMQYNHYYQQIEPESGINYRGTTRKVEEDQPSIQPYYYQ